MDESQHISRSEKFMEAVQRAADEAGFDGFVVLGLAEPNDLEKGEVDEAPDANVALPITIAMRCKANLNPLFKAMLHMAKGELHTTVGAVTEMLGGVEKEVSTRSGRIRAAKPDSQQG